jgi:hypothetical protein
METRQCETFFIQYHRSRRATNERIFAAAASQSATLIVTAKVGRSPLQKSVLLFLDISLQPLLK